MAIPLTGTGGLFTRLGHIVGAANIVFTHIGGSAPLSPPATSVLAHANTIEGDFASIDQAIVAGLYPALATYQSTPSTFLTYLQTTASSLMVQMAADDALQPDATIGTALAYLVAQMKTASATVKACSIGSSVTVVGTPTGNPVLAVSTKLKTGLVAENSFAEVLVGTITNDAQSGTATSGREVLTLVAPLAASSSMNYLWPMGSGATTTLTAVSTADYQGGGTRNWLNNGDFEAGFASNVPSKWTIDVGTAGTTILQSNTVFYDGTNSLRFAGNGAELTSVYQLFNSSTGSTKAVIPIDQLAVNLWVNTSGSPAAGVLEVALTDGAGTITQDMQGTPNVLTKSLVGVSTWTPVTGFFRTPRVLPAASRLRIRLSTALTSGASAFIDRASLAEPVQPYTQGPALALFSGNVPLIVGDTIDATITNDRGGATVPGFQSSFDRLFNMRGLGLLLPSSGSPTISDSLIV